VITDLRENTFYATIHVERNADRLQIDARPSDAMAIAIRVGAPIFVEESVLERSRAGRDAADPDPSEQLRRWLEQVDPEDLGKYPM
jgi:bifunctional DNase/RNase